MTEGMLYVGSAGTSAWFSGDMGDTWVRPNSSSGLYLESRVWNLCHHPADPDHVLAGTDLGLFRWSENEQHWTEIPSPQDIWAVAQHPKNPDRILIGTRPAALHGSSDGGKTWTKFDTPGMTDFSGVNSGPTRVTQILFDPDDADTIWATVEINAIFKTTNGGRTWRMLDKGLVSGDVHGIAVVSKDGRRTIFVTTNKGLHRSRDEGETWSFQELDSTWQYTRAITPRADGKVLFLTNGNGPPGSTGRLLRSWDGGDTWEDVGLPGDLNSTPWCVATHPSDANLIFAATNLGQIFKSEDGGETWTKLRRELGEIRSMLWRPLREPSKLREVWMRDGRPW